MNINLKRSLTSTIAVIIAGVVIKVIHYPSYTTVCKRLLLFEITQGQAFEQLIKNGESRVPAGHNSLWYACTDRIYAEAEADPNNPYNPKNLQTEKPPAFRTKSSPFSISLAKHLKSIGAVKYSAYWSPHSLEQNELFGKKASGILINVECSKVGVNANYKLCTEKGITTYPSWEINGAIESGVKTLDELSRLSNFFGKKQD